MNSKKFNLKNVFFSYFFIICVIVLIYLYLSNISMSTKLNKTVIFTFFINAVFIIVSAIKDSRSFSLNKTFWYFNFFFLFLAPLLQYLSNYKMWQFDVKVEDYIKTNIVLFIWFLIYFLFYNYVFKGNIKSKKEEDAITFSKTNLNRFVFISLISLVIMSLLIGFKNLFLRSANNVVISIGFINTIVNNSLRTISVYSLAYSLYYFKKEKKCTLLYIIVFFILTIILNYPVSTTRYWSGAVYLGIAIIMFKNIIKGRMFDIGLLFVFAILFPIFQLFKWYGLTDIINGNATRELINVYNNADFDAYSMFVRAFYYVDENSITYGKQLFSTLLFFIPRAIWPNKSLPTGELIATFQNQTFTNLSCPLPAEAYVNFGYIGIIIYAIILSWGFKKMDCIYWKTSNKIRYIDYIYPFSIGLLILWLRGSFHPATIYIFVFYLVLIIIKLATLFRKEKNNVYKE